MCVANLCAILADVPLLLLAGTALFVGLFFLRWCIHLRKMYFLFLLLFILSYCHADTLLQQTQLKTLLESEDYVSDGIYGEVTGNIADIVEKEEYVQLIVKQCEVNLTDSSVSAEVLSSLSMNESGDEINMIVYCYDMSIIETVSSDSSQSQSGVLIGDKVLLNGTIKAFTAARNEGEFDGKVYYQSIGMDYKTMVSSLTRVGTSGNQLKTMLAKLRTKLNSVYHEIADDTDAGIYSSIVLGDKSGLDEEIKDLYQSSGIAHLLAISGLHIALIGMTLYHLLRKCGLSFLSAGMASGIVILCYGIMTGNGTSATRAIIMFLFAILADITGRTYDILSALSFSAIFLLYQNPYVLQNSGFLLSFGAILGITLVEPAMEQICCVKRIKKIWIQRLLQSMLISISINLVTLPVILYSYFQIPTYSFLLNLVVIPLMSIVMMCTILAGITGLCFLWAGTFFIGAAHYILQFYEWICRVNAAIPYSTIVLGQPSALQITGYYVLLFIMIILVRTDWNTWLINIQTEWEMIGKNSANIQKMKDIVKIKYVMKIKNAMKIQDAMKIQNAMKIQDAMKIQNAMKIQDAVKIQDAMKIQNVHDETHKKDLKAGRFKKVVRLAGITLLVAAIYVICPHADQKTLEIRMIDVGQGDSIFIRTPNQVTYLFDGGSTDIEEVGERRILPVLKANAVTCLDYIVVSHSDSDHISGILELMELMDQTFVIKNLILPNITDPDDAYLSLAATAEEKGITVHYVNTGDQIGAGMVSMKCLHPDEGYLYDSENDYSTNILIQYQNFDLLMTGDVEEAGENEMIQAQRLCDIDILKVAHHGSSSSTTQEFVDIVQPKIGIISCGINNSYGHPASSTVDRLTDAGTELFVTSTCGEIIIRTDGTSISLCTRLK